MRRMYLWDMIDGYVYVSQYASSSSAVDDLWKQAQDKAVQGGRKGMHWWEWSLGQLAANSDLDSNGNELRLSCHR